MTITVETGAGVANANSYVTLAEARTYAKARGVTLTAFDDVLEQYLIKAMDYLESLRADYRGIKTDSTYALQWPRYGVYLDGVELDSNVIPTELKNAQVALAMAVQDGVDLMPTQSGDAFVVSEKVGPIETRYSEGVSVSGVPIVRSVEALLAPLLKATGALSTVRA